MGVALLEGDYSTVKNAKIYELKGSNQIQKIKLGANRILIIWNKSELIFFFSGSAII